MEEHTKRCFEFGPFRVDPAERVLLREGESVALTSKLFDILLLLVENSGRVVEKDRLMNEVWPNTFVEEGNLTQNISVLRKALKDDGHQYIQTVPRRGYRFVGNVHHSTKRPGAHSSSSLGARRTRMVESGGCAGAVFVAG